MLTAREGFILDRTVVQSHGTPCRANALRAWALVLCCGLPAACAPHGASSLPPQSAVADAAHRASATARNCFHVPGACGYPDPAYGNVGVPRSAALTPSGSIAVRKPGAVLQNLDVTGTITIYANNVTIRNVRLTVTGHGSGVAGIWIESGASGTTIEDSTVRGSGVRRAPESAIFNHAGEGLVLTRVYFYNFADPLEGPATVTDSYLNSNGTYGSGSNIAHIEDIYASDARVTVRHSVLLNPFGQTATVFMDTNGGQGGAPGDDHLTITSSLLAGGGWTLYPSAKSVSAGSERMNVSANRFARCLTAPLYDSSSGGTSCKGGPDTHGYYPFAGYYGVAADLYCPPKRGQTWSNNVWDDDGSPIRCP
jgi:hypothetical protein